MAAIICCPPYINRMAPHVSHVAELYGSMACMTRSPCSAVLGRSVGAGCVLILNLLYTGMWIAGWQVMATKQVHMTHDKEEGGTHKPETAERCWGKQQSITSKVIEVSAWPHTRAQPTCHGFVD